MRLVSLTEGDVPHPLTAFAIFHGLHASNPYRVLNRATPPKRGPPGLLGFCAWTQHRSRYPFRTYARLALFVALLSVVNALLTSLVQNVVGDFNLVFDTVIALGMIDYLSSSLLSSGGLTARGLLAVCSEQNTRKGAEACPN